MMNKDLSVKKTSKFMSEEEQKKLEEELYIVQNVAYILTDTVNSYYMDLLGKLEVFGWKLEKEDKMHFNAMKKAIENAKYHSQQITKHVYNLKDAEGALYDADWFYNIIKMLYDRLGEDARKTNMLLEFLDAMPSEGVFKIGLKDFQKL